MNLFQRSVLPVLTLAAAFVCSVAPAQPTYAQNAASYNLVPLDVPGSNRTQPRGLNDLGSIVGTFRGSDNATKGFFYKNGTYATLQAPGATATFTLGINNWGVVVGYGTFSGVRKGFLLQNGTYTTLAYPGATQTLATGINDWGSVIGTYVDAAGAQHGFLFRGNQYTSLDVPNSGYTIPYAINNWGTIVGAYSTSEGEVTSFKRFRLGADGTYTTIAVEGLEEPTAFGTNDWGVIVGNYEEVFGFILYPNQTFRNVDVPGSSAVWVQDINNRGAIVGYYQDAVTGAYRGYVGEPKRSTK